MINHEQTKGIIERVVGYGLMFAAGRKWIPGELVNDIGAIVMGIFGVAWAWKINTTPSLVAATISMPKVKSITTTQEVAEKVDNPAVKSSTK